MNKIIVICCVLAILSVGCVPSGGSRLPVAPSKPSAAPLEYEGKWLSKDYKVIKIDGHEVGFGSELYLKNKGSGLFEMALYDISSPPASRIASIETEVAIPPNAPGKFMWDDDGWGSFGTGTIQMRGDTIVMTLESQVKGGANPDWRIYGGERVFVKQKK